MPDVLPQLFALPVGADFPVAFAHGLLDRMAGQRPEDLARVTVFLNTARMRERVRTALQDRGPGLLPRLLLLSDLGSDPGFDAPPAVPSLRRRLELARPVARLLQADRSIAPASAVFDLADSLARLAEEMADEGVAPERFEGRDLAEDHAQHWETSLRFLRIVAPWFAGDAAPDAATRQRRAVEALIAGWQVAPPDTPVIVAGSTGSRGTTALLMQAVARLPLGAVVLPGLDFDMPRAAWTSLFDADVPNEDHPQHRHARMMLALGVEPQEVQPWVADPPADPARNRLLSLALRPAPVTDQWLSEGPEVAPLAAATAALSLIEAPDPRGESLAIALALRDAAVRGESAVLVTPDRVLARRVSAALDRYGIAPDDSAGSPLHLSAAGRLVRQVAGLFGRRLTVEALLALAKHPLVASGEARGDHLLLTREWELTLRRHGPVFPDGAAVRAWAARRNEPFAGSWADWLGGVLADVPGAAERPILDWTERLRALATRLSAGPLAAEPKVWQGADGEAVAKALDDLAAEAAHGDPLSGADFGALLLTVLQGAPVLAGAAADMRIAIKGPREARELSADLVILGGLNEGSWPGAPGPDPWLSRQMRLKAGLLLPERQIGLAAHDFQQAAAVGSRVILSRALRDDEAETIGSRWIERLTNLVRGLPGGPEALATMRARGQAWLREAQRTDRVVPVASAPRPAPRPPISARPRELPVTAIARLIRDPYAIYAQYILRLKPLDPLVPEADPGLRGQVLHAVVEQFLRERPEGESAVEAEQRLISVAGEVLDANVAWPSARRLWLARIRRFAAYLAASETERARSAEPVVVEESGRIDLPGLGFTLTARPDRIDLGADGRLHIYDYKSGKPPSDKQQEAFDKQLLLQAAMAERGAFAKVGPREVAAVSYIHLGGEGDTRTTTRDKVDFDAEWAGLQELIRRYLDPAMGYSPRRALVFVNTPSDYDHLSRFGEWAMTDAPVPEDVGHD